MTDHEPVRGADDLHRLEIVDADGWADVAARLLAERMAAVIGARDHCTVALSGGSTPAPVFRALAGHDLDWDRVVLLQVDERLVPLDHPDRNLTDQRQAFGHLPVAWLPLPVDEVLAEGVLDGSGDPVAGLRPIAQTSSAVGRFVERLHGVADRPPLVDLVHLGLGADGHTASLFPDDPAGFELRNPVAVTDVRAGHRRLTLTRSVLDRARSVFWLVRGEDKAPALGRVLAGDLGIPAGLIRPAYSVIVADSTAARQH